MPNELLDDNLQQSITKTPVSQRIAWYGKHTAAIMALNIVVLIITVLILPNTPLVLEDYVSGGGLALLMFGMWGITMATYFYGLKWNVMGAFFGGATTFVFCFAYTMTNLELISAYYQKNFAHWFSLPASVEKEGMEILLIGISYSLLIIPCTEILVVIGILLIKIGERIEAK